MLPIQLSAQNQFELISFTYASIGETSINNNEFSNLNNVKIATSSLNISLNYGHPVGEKNLKMFYGMDFSNTRHHTNLSNVIQDSSFFALPESYYLQPDYATLSGSIGLEKTITKKWTILAVLSTNLTTDFSKNKLKNNLLFGNITYVEKKVNDKLSFGFGIYLNQLEGKLFTSPLLSFNYKNNKRGINLIFPSSIRLYQKVFKSSYFEFKSALHSHSLTYASTHPILFTDAYNLNSGISYHYIWQDFLKFSIGVNLPLRFISVSKGIDDFNYSQVDNLGFSIGISLVVADE